MADKRFGGFWRRFWAFCIDQFLLYLLSRILYLIGMIASGFGRLSFTLGGFSEEMGPFKAIYLGATVITTMLYFTWFHGTLGRTPGKMILGLKVIQVSGDRMTLGVAFLRWVGTLVSGIILGLGYLWVAFDGRKQGWHDKIAATLVVRTGNAYAAVPMAAPDAVTIGTLTEEKVPPPAPLQEGESAEETTNHGTSPAL